jgi:Family of unknown function (DUF6152)
MRKGFLLVTLVACSLLVATVPLSAHHSFAAQYDRNKQATLTGPVTKVDWINPHARFLLNVTDTSGKVVSWEVELAAPAMLMRRGWSRTSLTVGQVVTVNGSLAKDGSHMINASTVTLADGKRIFAGSSGDSDTSSSQQ